MNGLPNKITGAGGQGQLPMRRHGRPRRSVLSLGPDVPMKRRSQTEENYGRFEADDRSWDAAFWQRQGSEAIRGGLGHDPRPPFTHHWRCYRAETSENC